MATNKEMIKVDELNRLYNSRDPNDVIKFYDNFNTSEELIGWSRNRPHGRAKIYTVKGDTDIVVVIPTADRHGKYAKNCEKEIFKGQQIVFVESGGRDDPYFNYARNCNIGLRYALRYKPKWIILSNDDVYKIDSFLALKERLLKINNKMYDTVYIDSCPDNYHSYKLLIGEANKFLLNYREHNEKSKKRLEIFKKFSSYPPIELLPTNIDSLKSLLIRLTIKKKAIVKQIGDFAILSGNFCEITREIFDENYINQVEDVDLSLRLKNKAAMIKFRIGSYRGSTLDNNFIRSLRNLISYIYFNYKLKKKLIII